MLRKSITIFFCGRLLGVLADDHGDCSHKFKSRLASFEYQYYHSNYLYPYHSKHNVAVKKADEETVKTKNKYQWRLHDMNSTGENGLYMESMQYPNYYLHEYGSARCSFKSLWVVTF